MQAGDWGHDTLVFEATYGQPFDSCEYTYGDFTNATGVTLICIGPDFKRRTFECNISPNNARVSYTPEAATDFPLNGVYNSELEVLYATGGPLHSRPFVIIVGPAY